MAARRSPRGPARRAVAPVERREWSIASDVQAISPIVELVQGLCVSAGFPARHCRLNIPVSVTEALSNAIMRGNGGDTAKQVHIAVMLEPSRLVVDVTDEGVGFDLEAMQHTPDEVDWLEREDGRGLFLMRSLMDLVESRQSTAPQGHTLRLVLLKA
jgi:serine/threonine-protein kinase RsbW